MLRIAFLDVGQGDTIVVHNPQTDEAIIVDCLNPLAVLDFLQCEKVRHVRAVILTHLHNDHYEGVVQFLEDCRSRGISWDTLYFYWINNTKQLKHLLDDGDGHSNPEDDPDLWQKKKLNTYRLLVSWSKDPSNRGRIKSPELLDGVDFPGIKLERLHPIYSQIGHLESVGFNNVSVVLRVSAGKASALLTGDLEPEGWDLLLENTSNFSSDVLKFPHHGAWKREDVNAMIDIVSPKIVVISVGTIGYKFSHPNSRVFGALKSRPGIRVICTQATKQCAPDPTAVQAQVNAFLTSAGDKFSELATSAGCSCASTIIVELDENASIIYPPPNTHLQVINECFPLAQCRKSL